MATSEHAAPVLPVPGGLGTRAEVGAFLKVPVGTLEQWATRGIGPRYHRVGRHARYLWDDVVAWLNQTATCCGSS